MGANAAADPDNPPLSPEELTRMRPVSEPREIRRCLRLTQEEFAARFGVPLALLRVFDRNPEAVVQALVQ